MTHSGNYSHDISNVVLTGLLQIFIVVSTNFHNKNSKKAWGYNRQNIVAT